MTETLTQRLQRAVALRDAPGRTKGDWIASTKSNAILCADDGTSLAHAIRAEDRDFIAAAPSIVQLAVELGAEVERLEARQRRLLKGLSYCIAHLESNKLHGAAMMARAVLADQVQDDE